MRTIRLNRLTKSLIFSLTLVCFSAIVQAQDTPPPSPTPTPTPSADDILKNLQARPLPPMPDLSRVGVDSTNVLSMTMNEAIRKALENNNAIEIAKTDVRINETSLLSLEGIFDPVFRFTPQASISVSDNTLVGTNFDGTLRARQFQRTTISADASFDKLLTRGGGSYSVFFNNSRDRFNTSQGGINPSYSTSLGVQFIQPLMRNRKIDGNRRNILVQKKRLQQSDADFRRSTIDVISQVQRAYWDLVFAIRDQQNRLENLNLTRENLRRVEAQIAAGAAAPLSRAEVQTELANREADLLVATQSVSSAENILKQLIFRDQLDKEWSAQIVPTDRPVFSTDTISLNDAVKDAIANRPELQRLRFQQEINNVDIDYFRNQTKPRLDFTSTVTTTGIAGNSIPINPGTGFVVPPKIVGGYGTALGNLFKADTGSIVVGVTLEIPIRNRTAEANLAGAQIQKEQLAAQTRQQEQTILVEVRNAVQAVETARMRVETSRIARENAEIQLAGEQKLFQVGRSTTFLLFQRENALANARNAEIRAQTDYNKALADLQKATSTTLRVNNVTIQSPTNQP